jgi:hypothetical protein
MAITAALAIGVAMMPLAGCGDGDDTTTVITTSAPTETAPTEGTTGATGAEGETTTATEGASPLQELVGGATRRIPSEVDCDAAPDATTGTCQVEDTEIVVADAGETLELDTLTARLASLEATKQVSTEADRTPGGIFILGKLSIGNRTNRPEFFDFYGEQTQLKIGRTTYGEDYEVLRVLPGSFFSKNNQVRPKQTQVGSILFDVPPSEQDAIETNGALIVINFGDTSKVSQSSTRRILDAEVDQVGLIRTSNLRDSR